jgi:hypothetical protein
LIKKGIGTLVSILGVCSLSIALIGFSTDKTFAEIDLHPERIDQESLEFKNSIHPLDIPLKFIDKSGNVVLEINSKFYREHPDQVQELLKEKGINLPIKKRIPDTN